MSVWTLSVKWLNLENKSNSKVKIWKYLIIFLVYAINNFLSEIKKKTLTLHSGNVVDSSKVSMLLLDNWWDDWPIFMISGSNKQLQQQLEYTLLKPDCHSWWISKMQSGRDDTLEKRYELKVCFKLGKNATETYGMLQVQTNSYSSNWNTPY